MAENESPTLSTGEVGSVEQITLTSDKTINTIAEVVEKLTPPKAESKTIAKNSAKAAAGSPTTTNPSTFPPPKTDKPRPHVCTTCMRSFARLEHLKRHERSHTKEKPFECPSCTRCFARRDLLLRHQQKLHSTTTPSSKPRNGRRESTAGVANGRVRKSSVVSASNAAMRPRANTLSHIDTANLGLTQSGAFGRQLNLNSHHNSFSGMTINPNFGFRGIGGTNHPAATALPRLETSRLVNDTSNALRTAPPLGGFGSDFEMNGYFDVSGGNTINPHALHMHGMQGFSMENTFDLPMHSAMHTSHSMMEDDGFDWMTQGFENSQMQFTHGTEHAIEDSSPSMMSTNSPTVFTEHMTSTVNGLFMDNGQNMMASMWQPPVSAPPHVVNSPMSMDVNSIFGDMVQPMVDTVSPKSLLAPKQPNFDMNFPTPPELATVDPTTLATMSGSAFILPFKNEHMASTASSASIDSSLRQSSVTTTSSELVSDHMRSLLIAGLSQNSGFGRRKQSQPAISSPLSPNSGSQNKNFNAAAFPSTQDLQRYVAAYIKYFHPHLPFLHVATLNFESSEYSTMKSMANGHASLSTSTVGGGGCLLLAVAAIGALYEDEINHSRDLFDNAKQYILTNLEERHKKQKNRGPFAPYQRSEREDTPLWLVQALLLTVIYGHNTGDKTAADNASIHCASLVSLARGAELAKPYPIYSSTETQSDFSHGHNMHGNTISSDGWSLLNIDGGDSDWYEWKVMEERKRTLYAIFILSSLLVTAYNKPPALTNSEIRLDLPCEEELWAADSAHTWRALGGSATTGLRSTQFSSALTHLLTASQREKLKASQSRNGGQWTSNEFELRPSSFGCLVLINALHNYIWETRQRHLGRQWTPQEIDSMHAHVEPALRAWQAAWHGNPMHAIERPNPFGAGPLSADSIPLLDLAYVRLFVDFGRSKEAYWLRDYDTMAQELARAPDNAPCSNARPELGLHSPPLETDTEIAGPNVLRQAESSLHDSQKYRSASDPNTSKPAQRERHLRKAAFYAADHLITSDRLGVGLDERNTRELPMQSIMCACDSAQVLAEWAATVQERVGQCLGVLGRDDVNLLQEPSTVLLDDEDRKLLGMMDELLQNVESKRGVDLALAEARKGGYGSRLLTATSQRMAQVALWPVTKLMGRSLETQAGHIKARALASTPSMMI